MKKNIFISKTAMALLQAVVLFIIFNLIFILKRQFSPSEIIFYESIYVGIFCLSLCLITIKYLKLDLMAIFLAFSVYYGYAITLPILLDRSISIYILCLLESNESLTMADIESKFNDGFVLKNGAIPKRINEQIYTGNVYEVNNEIFLSQKGVGTINMWRKAAELYKTDLRYVWVNTP